MNQTRLIGLAGPLLVCLSLAACSEIAVDGHRVHSSGMIPSHVTEYPHVPYAGGEAILIGSDWLFRDDRYGWVIFDDEPHELRAYREKTYAPLGMAR